MESMGLLVLALMFGLTIFSANAALCDDEHGMTELVSRGPWARAPTRSPFRWLCRLLQRSAMLSWRR